MFRRVTGFVLILLLAGAGVAWAQQTTVQSTVQGTVVTVDPGNRLIVLQDGRTLRVAGDTRIIINGQPVMLEQVQPGAQITIVSAPATQVVPTTQTLRHTVTGTVTDVDRKGEVTIRAPDGSKFDVHVPPTTAVQVRKGDSVLMHLDFMPSQPAAFPR
jgi:translation initiation factor IF-1